LGYQSEGASRSSSESLGRVNDSHVRNAEWFTAQIGFPGSNDWKENPNGEGYAHDSYEGQPDLQRRVDDLVREIQPTVAAFAGFFAERCG